MKNVLRNLKAGAVALSAGLAALLWLATASATVAQTPPKVASLRLYVIDCGTLLNKDPKLGGLPGPNVDHSVPCYLIVHPKGSLLWETGVGKDAIARGGYLVSKTLKSQLDQIGYPASKITYLALSHYHPEHSGNSNDYAGSTWLTQKDQRAAMFGPWPGVTKAPEENADEWSALKNAKTILIPNKDYDVFGDGSVMLIYTPAVTPGHQLLLVNLPKTGPVLISGDLYTDASAHELYLQYTHQKMHVKPYPQTDLDLFFKGVGKKGALFTTPGHLASMNKVEALLTKTKATLWIQHDDAQYKTLKKSPAYYE